MSFTSWLRHFASALRGSRPGGRTRSAPRARRRWPEVELLEGRTLLASVLQFSQAAFGVREDGGTATVTVTRTGDTDTTVSVQFAASDGTGAAGADYTTASGTLTFSRGQTSQTFVVPVQADAVVEGTESVNLALSDPSGDAVLGAPSTAVLFLADPVPATVADEMLRVAYLIPSNRAPQPSAIANLQYAVRQSHAWYLDQMDRNGFGPKSFVYETQTDGFTPVVYMVFVDPTDADLRGGGMPIDLYNNNISAARDAGVPVLNTPGQVWLLTSESHLLNPDGSLLGTMALGASFGSGGDPGVGQVGSNSLSLFSPSALADDRDYDGLVLPEIGPYPLRFDVTFPDFNGMTVSSISSTGMGAALHEIAHGFGLPHDFRNDQNFHGNLMGNGFRGFRNEVFPTRYPGDETRLTHAEALTLNVSRYFNPDLIVTDNVRPAVSVLTSGAVVPENGLVRIEFTASDTSGLAVAVLRLNGSNAGSVGELPLSGTGVTTAFFTPYYTPGQANDYTISVYDLQGNRQNAGFSLTPAGGHNRAPRPSFRLLPSTVEVDQPVTLDASATTDPDHASAVLLVEWDLDGDGVFDTAPTTTKTLTQVFPTAGARLIRVRVTDPAGAQTVSTPLALHVTPPNTPPTITDLPDRSIDADTSTGAIPFTVGDAQTLEDALLVSASSSNQALVPDANIVFGGGGANRTVTVTPAPGQTGTATITVTVRDGGLTASDTFVLSVSPPAANRAPVLAPVADRTVPSSQDLITVPLTATDPDGDGLSFSATAQSLALVLDRQLGLRTDGGNLYDNYFGAGERWLLDHDDQWYFILPDGRFYLWDGNPSATGTLAGTPGATYHARIDLLYNAQLAFDLDAQLGLQTDGGNLYEDWGGRGERWLLDRDNQWYFILPTGELYRWDSSSQATGTLVATPGDNYHDLIGLLYEGDQGQALANLQIAGNNLTVDRDDGFITGLVVTATASDGELTDSKTFTVTVTADEFVAETGFNDAAGIRSDPIPGSPYELGSVAGMGGVEPGWAGPWTGGLTLAQVQNATVFEGDQALEIRPTSAPRRAVVEPMTGVFVIEQYVRFDAGARLVAYTEVQATDEAIANQGPVWIALPDGTFNVVDGVEDGCITCATEVAGFWSPGVWYQVRVVVDMTARTWEFYLNGVRYNAPDPLGFRGTPPYLDQVRYLSEGSGSVYLDALRISRS